MGARIRRPPPSAGGLDQEEPGAQRHLLAGDDVDRGDGAVERRLEAELHLHRLHHPQRSPSATGWPSGHPDVEDGAGHRRDDRAVPGPGALVGEHVGPHEDPAVALVDDLDGVPPSATTASWRRPSRVRTEWCAARAGRGQDLAHLGLVDPVAGPVDAHDVVELDQHRRGVPGEPPAVGRERSRVGPVREDRHVGPGGEDAGQVVVGGRIGRGVQPGGVDRGVAELVAGDERPQEPEVGGEPEDRGVVERGDEGPPGALAVRAAGDDLAEHGVVRRADDAAGLQRRVDPGAIGASARRRPCRPAAGTRGTGPRRRRGPRSRARSAVRSSWVNGSGSPAATRSSADQVDVLAAAPVPGSASCAPPTR